MIVTADHSVLNSLNLSCDSLIDSLATYPVRLLVRSLSKRPYCASSGACALTNSTLSIIDIAQEPHLRSNNNIDCGLGTTHRLSVRTWPTVSAPPVPHPNFEFGRLERLSILNLCHFPEVFATSPESCSHSRSRCCGGGGGGGGGGGDGGGDDDNPSPLPPESLPAG